MTEATTAPPAEPKRGFKLPSAYTILFALIVLMALATWLIPAGAYQLDKEGAPIPGTYTEVDGDPQRILIDSLTAPINGLYGIEDADGKISYYNTGVLFGAIDVALFIIVIGGFLGVTMRTGAIQTGIGRLVARLRGRERWMIPILMMVFALGGSTYGMAEESLAFYTLVIAVMIAAGYDALTGAAIVLLGLRDRHPGLDDQPVRDRHRLRVRRHLHQRGPALPADHPRRRARTRDLLRDAVRRAGQGGPHQIGGPGHEGGQRGPLQRPGPDGRGRHDHPRQGHPGGVRPGLRHHDVRRHPLGGHGHRDPHAVVVVPGDDRAVHPLLGDHRTDRTVERDRPHRLVRRRRPRPARGRADHRHRPRNHRGHEQRRDHRHRAALGRAGGRRASVPWPS